MVKPNSYYTVQAFMINDLNLRGNELVVYAIIYGFTQNGDDWFTGSLNYLADWTNGTKRGVQKNLEKLIEKNLIEKKSYTKNNVRFCEYRAVVPTMEQNSTPPTNTNFVPGIEHSSTGVWNTVPQGIEHSSTNNINNNINNKLDLERERAREATPPTNAPNPKTEKPVKPTAHKHGEYGWVRLTDEQHKRLVAEYGNDTVARVIQYVDELAQQTTNKNGWKDWNLVIRRAIRENWGTDKFRHRNNNNVVVDGEHKPSYDLDEFERHSIFDSDDWEKIFCGNSKIGSNSP